MNNSIAKILSRNFPNLESIIVDAYNLMISDNTEGYNISTTGSIQNIKCLKKLTFRRLNSNDFGEKFRDNSTLKYLKFENCALSGNDLLNIARKCCELETLYIAGKIFRENQKYLYPSPILLHLCVQLEQMNEILKEISVNGALKNLQILNVCLIRSIHSFESDITSKDIEKFAKLNFLPIIESNFAMDCYIKICFLEPNHPKQEGHILRFGKGQSLVMLEKKINQKPQVTVYPYPTTMYSK